MNIQTEVCVDSVAGVRVAGAAGADRVELCSALEVGGLTPSLALIEQAVHAVGDAGPKVQVLIRPRAGDFLYDAAEIRCMYRDVGAAIAAGAAGVVVGALQPDGRVDEEVVARLVSVAQEAGRARNISVEVTFHRAFDVAVEPFAALDTLQRLGFDRILTSGQAATAPEGAALLTELVRRSHAGPVDILAGGGIRADTVAGLVRVSGVRQVHFSGRATIRSDMQYQNPLVTMGRDGDEYSRQFTDIDAVQAIIAAARQTFSGC